MRSPSWQVRLDRPALANYGLRASSTRRGTAGDRHHRQGSGRIAEGQCQLDLVARTAGNAQYNPWRRSRKPRHCLGGAVVPIEAPRTVRCRRQPPSPGRMHPNWWSWRMSERDPSALWKMVCAVVAESAERRQAISSTGGQPSRAPSQRLSSADARGRAMIPGIFFCW